MLGNWKIFGGDPWTTFCKSHLDYCKFGRPRTVRFCGEDLLLTTVTESESPSLRGNPCEIPLLRVEIYSDPPLSYRDFTRKEVLFYVNPSKTNVYFKILPGRRKKGEGNYIFVYSRGTWTVVLSFFGVVELHQVGDASSCDSPSLLVLRLPQTVSQRFKVRPLSTGTSRKSLFLHGFGSSSTDSNSPELKVNFPAITVVLPSFLYRYIYTFLGFWSCRKE